MQYGVGVGIDRQAMGGEHGGVQFVVQLDDEALRSGPLAGGRTLPVGDGGPARDTGVLVVGWSVDGRE